MAEAATAIRTWSVASIGDLTGKVALVTGATSGIGESTARVLAQHGASVLVGGRNAAKAAEVCAAVQKASPGARIEPFEVDLASLADIRRAAAAFRASQAKLDLLINNAGVMVPPYGKTADGFELQFGTNHLGHFALTGQLLGELLAAPGSRVVTVSSAAHRPGRMHWNDLQSERKYQAGAAYSQSKLANLLFTNELQRRLTGAGAGTIAVAAHPGWARTGLQRHASENWWWFGARLAEPFFSQSADNGALPTLRAATDPAVKGGEYYGPSGFMEGKGRPVVVGESERATNMADAARLWIISEELTGIRYERLA